jgi:type I restriction enzyme S subunit
MSKTKPSGIEWIGDIPAKWEISKIKYIFTKIGSGSTPTSDVTDYYDGDNPWIQSGDLHDDFLYKTTRSITELAIKNMPSLKLYRKGFIVIAMYGASIANVSFSKIDAYVNQACCVLAETEFVSMYYFYYLKSCRDILIAQAQGGTQPNIAQYIISGLKCIVPPYSEQQAIASFLDAQCEKIDGIITAMKQQIEVLKQYKTSLITETVTKGLDKSAPMKDSGIDWIGRIPAHWKIKPVKYNLKSNEKTLKETTESDYIMRYVDISSVNFDDGITAYEEISFGNAPSRARRIVKSGDTIVSTVRTYLKAIARISDDKNVIVSTGFAVLSPQGNDPAYIEYFCKSDGFCSEIEKFSYGIAYPAINESVLINIKMLVPPISEQKVIAAYLESKCTEITAIISEKQTSIATIKSYKKSLIYEYVTGKKRVKI